MASKTVSIILKTFYRLTFSDTKYACMALLTYLKGLKV